MTKRLDENQTRDLGHLLSQRRDELREEIREELERLDVEQYRQMAGEVHDMEDLALAHLLTEMNHSEINRHRHELDEVNAALRRVAEGAYGICVDCGKEIGFPRLSVQPTAKRCVRCQESVEKNQRGAYSTAP